MVQQTRLIVPNGGTDKASFTAYSVICAGTTSTSAFQNVSGLGTAGQQLTSNGAGALPTWQNDPLANYSFSAYVSANTSSVTGDTTEVIVPFDTKTGTGWDTNGNFNTSTNQYTTPVQGEYEFEFGVRLSTTTGLMAAHTRCVAYIYARDGGGTAYNVAECGDLQGAAASRLSSAPNDDGLMINCATRMRLPAGYTVECRCAVDGASKNVYIGGLSGATKVSYFSGRCVSTY